MQHYYPSLAKQLFLTGLVWLLGAVALLSPASAQTGGVISDVVEKQALIDLYNSTTSTGTTWSTWVNWFMTPAQPLSAWTGVTVRNGDVVGLNLRSSNLVGPLPANLGDLAALEDLDIKYNTVTGPLPASFGTLPKLKTFIADYNQLTGAVPVPTAPGGLALLTLMSISRNRFSTIPSGIGTLTNLVSIDARSNKITEVPAAIGQLSMLKVLDLSHNAINVPLPSSLGSLTALESLSLGVNAIPGTIPLSLSQLTALKNLSFTQNKLTGSIPFSMGNLQFLTHFDVSNNNLSGELPTGFGSMVNLQYLDVSRNGFSGALPEGLARLPQLQTLRAFVNKFTSIPNFRQPPTPAAITVDVSTNAICFGPLEPNVNGAAGFNYLGQVLPTGEDVETQGVNEPIVITCSFSGTRNVYQWEKRNPVTKIWEPLSNTAGVTGATESVLRIQQPVMGNAGRYRCLVTNQLVTNLTLFTRTTNIVLTPGTATLVPVVQPPIAEDRNLNWTIERTYDGVDNSSGNILSEAKQFTDGLGRATQAQARSRATPHVFASQAVYSSDGQPVLQTLAAPTNNQSFAYKEAFITVVGQPTVPYGPTNFEDGKADNPDAVDTTVPGTLGHYFSNNNTFEPLTPITQAPFSLTQPADGPLGGVKRAAAPGDAFRMGSGHEAKGREIPLLKEFDHYMSLRHHFVPGSNNLVTLQRQGTKSISIDADGRESVVVADKEGQALISCLTNTLYPPTTVSGVISTDPNNPYEANAPSFLDIHIPATGEHTLVLTRAGQVHIQNLNGEAGVRLTGGGLHTPSLNVTLQNNSAQVLLLPGFYRLTSLPSTILGEQTQEFEYQAEYGNFSYTYYDDAGRAVASVAPMGLEGLAIQGNTLPSYVTRNIYDTSSRLLATESAEEGRTEYVYARDGRIRFSQSALQQPAGRFSYSNYDDLGRVVESGEYTPSGSTDLVFQNQLPRVGHYEAEGSSATLGGVATSHPLQNPGYVDNFVQANTSIDFTVNAPTAGRYLVRVRYAAGQPEDRTLPLYLQTGITNRTYLYNVTFPATNSWDRWDIVTLEVQLTQGTNQIRFQQNQPTTGPLSEGLIRFDYLELVSEQLPTANSVLNILEERTPNANSLLAANCSQRNYVTYDEAVAVAGRTPEFTLGAVAQSRNDKVTTSYSYDELGRVTWAVQDIAGLGLKTLDYSYDFAGNVLEVAYQHGKPDAFHHYYEYDRAQRLYKVYTSTDGTERTLQAKYFYYLHGPLKRVELANRLQGLDYTYTLQGWLKSINHVNQKLDPGLDSPASNNVPKDLFALTLDYFSGDYQSRNLSTMTPVGLAPAGNPLRYDGTIRAAAWRTAASPDRHQVLYQYDAKSQLAETTYGKLGISGAFYQFNPVLMQANPANPTLSNPLSEGNLAYDANGNMRSLQRRNQTGVATDDFSYEYTEGTNRLKTVHGGGSLNGPDVLNYEYDALGQMTREQEGGQNRYMHYDVSGKVTRIASSTASNSAIVSFTYDDKGFRHSKITHDENGDTENTTYYVRDLAGNVLGTYESNYGNAYTPTRTEVPLYGASRVGTLTRLDNGTQDARYELNDHLGTARVVFHRPTTTTTTQTMALTEPHTSASFSNVDLYRAHLGVGVARSDEYVAQLDGRLPTPPSMARQFPVEQGDTITFTAWGRFSNGFGAGTPTGQMRLHPVLVLGAPANAIDGQLPDSEQPARRSTATGRLLSRVAAGISFALGGNNEPQYTTSQPGIPLGPSGAWVRYHLDYDDGSPAEDRTEFVDLSAVNNWQMVRLALRTKGSGTLTVSVGSQDQGGFTYFDDLTVERTGGMIVQEQHTYAYGAPLPGLSYTVGNKRYRHGYQGQYAENDEESGYESFELRMYNSRIGRWTSNDPYGQFASPYEGMGNNPVSFTDPDGGCVGGPCPPPLPKIPIQELTDVSVVSSRAAGAYARLGAQMVNFGLQGLTMMGDYSVGFGSAVFNDIFMGAPYDIAESTGYHRRPATTTAARASGEFVGHLTGTVIGLGITALGTVGTLGGGALSLTGGGAVIGVPAIEWSIGATIYGLGLTGTAATGLVGSGTALLNMAGNSKGGGKNASHANLKARQSAQKNLAEAEKELTEASKILPRTPASKARIEAAKKAIKHWRDKVNFTGENHSQTGKGY